MADETLIDKTAATSLVAGDLLYSLRDPAGTPLDRKITYANLLATPQPIGSTTPNTGAFTTLTASTSLTINGLPLTPLRGTFTPTLSGTTIAGSPVFSIASGKYTRIGNDVFIWVNIALSDIGGMTGFIRMGNLPFAIRNTSPAGNVNRSGAFVNNYTNVDLGAGFIGMMAWNLTPTQIALYRTSQTTTSAIAVGQITNTTALYIYSHYETT